MTILSRRQWVRRWPRQTLPHLAQSKGCPRLLHRLHLRGLHWALLACSTAKPSPRTGNNCMFDCSLCSRKRLTSIVRDRHAQHSASPASAKLLRLQTCPGSGQSPQAALVSCGAIPKTRSWSCTRKRVKLESRFSFGVLTARKKAGCFPCSQQAIVHGHSQSPQRSCMGLIP